MEKIAIVLLLLAVVCGFLAEEDNKSKSSVSSSSARAPKQLLYSPFLFPGNYQAGFPSNAHTQSHLSPVYSFWNNLQTVPALYSSKPNVNGQQGLQLTSQLPVTAQQQQEQQQQVQYNYPYQQQQLPLQQHQQQQRTPLLLSPQSFPYNLQSPSPLAYSQVYHGNIWNFDDSLTTNNNNNNNKKTNDDSSSKRDALNYYFAFPNVNYGAALDNYRRSQVVRQQQQKELELQKIHQAGFQRGNIESRPGTFLDNSFSGFVRSHIESPPRLSPHGMRRAEDHEYNNNNHHGHSRVNTVRQSNNNNNNNNGGAISSFNRGAVEGPPDTLGKPSDAYSAVSPYAGPNGDKKVVCYFANWANYRKGKGAFVPENVDPTLCTHVIYAFATFDKAKVTIAPSDNWTDVTNNFFGRIVALKERNPDLKVLLAVGGWADSGDDKYSNLAHSPSQRQKFAQESLAFLKKYGFDGLAVDWHYPKCWQSNCDAGPGSDSVAFGDLLRALKSVYAPEGLLLSATLSGYKEVIDLAYHVPTLNGLLDLMNIMTYDYHGAWESTTGHVSPLFQGPAGFDNYPHYNSNFTMEYYVSLGADRSKLVMGVPMYGQTFQLSRGTTHVGSEAEGPGNPGEFTQQPGMLAYYEICSRVKNKGWTVYHERSASWGPIAYDNSGQWVGYDDPEFVARKARYVKAKGFGGVFVWTMDLDDFNNDCCTGSQPLLRTIARELLNIPFSTRQQSCTPPPPISTPSPISTTTFKTPVDSSGVTVTNETLSVGTPCNSSTFTIVADANDCSTYYQCVYDRIVVQSCSPGLHYNAEGQKCDWPAQAKCYREPSTGVSTTTTYPTYPTYTTSAPQTTSTWPSWSPHPVHEQTWGTSSAPSTPFFQSTTSSSVECYDGEYLPAETCDSYYLCTMGRKTLQHCGPGLHWDKNRRLCDWPSSAQCEGFQQKIIQKPMDQGIRQQPCQEGSFTSSRSDCTTYYVCVHGENVPFKCQGGLYWNQGSKICDWPSSAGCTFTESGSVESETVSAATQPPQVGYPVTDSSRPVQGSQVTPGTTVRPRPTPPELTQVTGQNVGSKSDYMVVCYFTNWAWYRQGLGKYKPDNINPNLCTHVIYGFAVLDYERLVIKVFDSWADIDNKFYDQVTALKAKGIKVSIAIGGWNDSQGDKYSRLVNNPQARARFVQNVVEFIGQYNFDGLDLDWEYPKCWQVECNKGPDSDKPNFAALVRELKEAFRPHGYLLSAAVSPSKTVVDLGYEVPTLSKYLDWIAVMTYDFHGQWDKKTGHVAPLYFHEEDDFYYFNANYSINYWISQGADRRKIVMGMPLYGQSFTLVDPSNTGLNSPSSGGGQAGPYTRAAGFLAYYEICDNVLRDGWTVVKDPTGAMGPYAYKGNQWVSYDDVEMIARKSQLIRDLDLGGGMIWALDLDDFRNTCGQGEYPLLTTIKNVLSEPRKGQPSRLISNGNHNKVNNMVSTVGASSVPAMSIISSSNANKMLLNQQQQQQQQQQRPSPPIPIKTEDVENDVCSDEPFRPHEKNCNLYYQCLFGRYVVQRCPPGTFWNQNRCDWKCGNEPSTISGTGSGTTMTTQRPTVTSQSTNPATTTTRTTTTTTTRATTTTTTRQPWNPSPPQSATQPPSQNTGPPTGNGDVVPFTCPQAGPKPDWEPATATESNTATPLNIPPSDYKVVCYFTNWAWYRPGIGKYKPSDIDFNLCTHIAYGFAVLDPSNLVLRPHDGWADLENKFYRQVVQLKARGLKVVLALGGWNDSLGDKYSKLVNNPSARRRFIEHVVQFLERHCFDGLDLDWEYPKCWQVDCNKGPDSDKQGFADLVRELSEAFKPRGLLLSAAVSPSKTVIDQGYDVPTLSKYMDWISVMTYDYHGQWDKKTGHVAPLYFHEEDDVAFFNTNYTMNYWINQGADRKKLIMGMPVYGQSFTLVDPNDHGLNAKTSGGGTAGEFTRQSGFLAYYEICRNIQSRNWKVVQDESGAMGPYAYQGNQWASYDDINTIRRKSEYIKQMGLGGGMIWALDLDDFRNTCGCGTHPLLKTINRVLRRYPESQQSCNLS